MSNEPNYIVNSVEDIKYLSKIFCGRKLPDGIKKNIISWHNIYKKGKHLILFGNCINVAGSTCIKCDESMYEYGGYAGDTRTDHQSYFEPCQGFSTKERVLLLLRTIDGYSYPCDDYGGEEYLNTLYEDVGLTPEQGKKFYLFYQDNNHLIEVNDKNEIIGFKDKPEEYR